MLQALPGLLPIFHSWCEHNEPRPCGRVPEQIYFSSPLAQGDFYNYDWKNTSLETKLRLFRTTLLGLQALHDRGIMHRDISRKNMLVLSIDPPDAVLCDYGKATKEVTSNFTCIGPVRTVAPEVWKTTYTKKIDIWSWAYAMAEILGYKCYTDEQIHPRRLGLIHEFLDSDEADTACGWDFASLLRKMLTWNPMHRPSVEEVLEHSCWDLIREMQKPVANYEKTTHLKRIKISEEQQELGEVGRPPSKLKQEPRQAYQSPSATQTSFLQDVETQQILPFPTLAENGSTQPFSSYPKPP